MSIMKKIKIKLQSSDSNILLPLVNINNLLGCEENIEVLIKNESTNSINSNNDLEVKRIVPETPYIISFSFYLVLSFIFLFALKSKQMY